MTKQAVRERGNAASPKSLRALAPEEPKTGVAAAKPEKLDMHNRGDRAEERGRQLVTFLLKDEEFGFDIMSVQEIIRLPKIAKLPHTPGYVEGVSNLRGAILPIIDIRARFGMESEERTERSRVLVLDVDGQRTGLLVDGVRQVTRVEAQDFEEPPDAIRNGTTDYVNGVVKLENGGRIIIALDARRVCDSGDSSGAKQTGNGMTPGDPGPQAVGLHVGRSLEAGDSDLEEQRKGREMRQLVSFQVGREEFAFPMEDVREILRVQTPKEVPGAPGHLLGVLTVRGQILPIVDLRRLLKLDSFAAEQIAVSRAACAPYMFLAEGEGEVLAVALNAAARLKESHEVRSASERLRSWLVGFNSSSQALMEAISRIREINEQAAKHSAAGDTHPDPACWHAEIGILVKAVVAALNNFQRQVESHIREDQRIIVVDSNGFKLGLVVDHVNEVLRIHEEAIEPPPKLGGHGGVGLSGIAKLDDGNRLILLLATGELLDRKNLAGIVRGVEANRAGPETGHAISNAIGSEGSTIDYELQLVTFLLGQEEYGIPIASIQEIDRLSKITQTPRAPKFVDGVTNLRGEVIPVLSTRTLFGLEPKSADDRTRVIIVDFGGAKTGLVVDAVKEVMSIPSRNIAPPPASITHDGEGQFISGIGKVDDGKRMIVLLDVERVLNRTAQVEVAQLGRKA